MIHRKPHSSENLDNQFNNWLDDWSKRHLPAWLYKQVTLHPDRALRPKDFVAERKAILLVLAVASIVLIVSLLQQRLHLRPLWQRRLRP